MNFNVVVASMHARHVQFEVTRWLRRKALPRHVTSAQRNRWNPLISFEFYPYSSETASSLWALWLT